MKFLRKYWFRVKILVVLIFLSGFLYFGQPKGEVDVDVVGLFHELQQFGIEAWKYVTVTMPQWSVLVVGIPLAIYIAYRILCSLGILQRIKDAGSFQLGPKLAGLILIGFLALASFAFLPHDFILFWVKYWQPVLLAVIAFFSIGLGWQVFEKTYNTSYTIVYLGWGIGMISATLCIILLIRLV